MPRCDQTPVGVSPEHDKSGPKNRPFGRPSSRSLCTDSKPPIQKHLHRRKDSLKNSHYPLCHRSSATPRCIGQTIFRTFAVRLGGKTPLLQSCFKRWTKRWIV